MASSLLKPSRLIAYALVIGAVAWIGSSYLSGSHEETTTAEAPAAKEEAPIQKVAVADIETQPHRRSVIMSCVTQADQRAQAVARGAGVLIDLKVSRGDVVSAGDVVAEISDEGRESNVLQAQALLDQRMSEYKANKKLIDTGDAPKNSLAGLESAVAAARAAVAAAEAEADRSLVKAPVDGVVNTVPVQVGQAIQAGTEIAEIIGPDPMLAVGYATERQRGSLLVGQTANVRFIDGSTTEGSVNFVALSGEAATRTYRVQAKFPNPGAKIADGVTCEMAVKLAPQQAAPVPRSALVFSDAGQLGVRIADAENKAQFKAVSVVDDTQDIVWVSGLDGTTHVIVVGQDFVQDGDTVQPETATASNSGEKPPA
jgi:multidrug efflux system membrane fusion protein